ncbi:MAG: SdrD B-like domain-containing protein [Eubacteriales bacterium]|nr:SdrD B-like domain-containing protein [Eubacteriales bacterium]
MMYRNKHMSGFIALLLVIIMGLSSVSFAESNGVISGTVMIDKNQDGFADSPDDIIDGVELSLIKVDDNTEVVVATAVSGVDGRFVFNGVSYGSYFIKALLPKDYIAAPLVEGGSFLLPSSGSSARTPLFNLADGETLDLQLDATKKSGYIKVIAFGDENANGGRFSTEPLLRKVLVEAIYEYGGVQYSIASDLTDKSGTAYLRDLTPGVYRIAVTLPDPYIIGPIGQKQNLFYNCIVPMDSNRGLSEPFKVPSGGSIGLGAGGVLTGKAAGQIYLDENANGTMDTGEKGLSGVKVSIANPASGVLRDFITQEDGSYLFERLQEGNYLLSVELPEGKAFTKGGNVYSAFSNKASQNFDVILGQTTQLNPIGVLNASTLTLKAFHDKTVNGLQDEGELPFSGAKLRLSVGAESVEASTDKDGVAFFPIVPIGDINASLTLPEGQVLSLAPQKGEGNFFGQNTAKNTDTKTISINLGEQKTLLAGVTLPTSIAGTVFDDSNISGIYEEGEGFLSAVTVQAVNAFDEVIAETSTDSKGQYVLSGLLPTQYKVRFVLKSPYIFSDFSNTGAAMENKVFSQTPAYGETDIINLSAAEQLKGIDAAVFKSAVVNGSVLYGFEEEAFSKTLGGISGVNVVLLNEDQEPVSQYTVATSDENGNFSLKGALPGNYYLKFTLPEEHAYSLPKLDGQELISQMFTLRSSEVKEFDSIFAVKTGSIQGRIYSDNNFDGVFSEGDTPLTGEYIKLVDSSGAVFAAASDAEGKFAVNALRPGKYTLKLTLPEEYLISFAQNSFVMPTLSNISETIIDLPMGIDLVSDIAASPKMSLDVSAFYDNNLNSEQNDTDSPYQMAEISIYSEKLNTRFDIKSDAFGMASIPVLHVGEYSLNIKLPEDHVVYYPNAELIDGLWDTSFTVEQGKTSVSLAIVQFGGLSGSIWNIGGGLENISNIPVELYYSDGNLAGSAVSGEDGSFSFTNMYPGEYYLKAQLPAGFRFARGIDAQNRLSLIVSETAGNEKEIGKSDILKLNMGEYKLNQDIGMGAMGQLGDFAWLDLDGDGMQDEGEPGIPDLTIRVYQYGNLVAETKTDAFGRYLFDSLYPGEYTIEAIAPAELLSSRKQTEFILVANILEENQSGVVRADGVMVPSNDRNLNADLGFKLKTPGKYPANMQNLPQKDWTPLVPYEPTRR